MRPETLSIWALALCLGVAPGCKDRKTTAGSPAAEAASGSHNASEICAVVAEVLSLKPEDVSPEKTLAELAADELDVVEIIMELEDKYDITISDEAIEREAAGAKPADLTKSLRVSSLAKVVAEARKAGARGTRPRN